MKSLFRIAIPLSFIVGGIALWWVNHWIPSNMRHQIKLLKDGTPEEKRDAAKRLKNKGNQAVPYLIKAMETGSREQKKSIASVLATTGVTSIPAVTSMLKHKDWRIREIGVGMLHKLPIQPEPLAQRLNRAFRDENPYVRYTAVRQLTLLRKLNPSVRLEMLKLLREGKKPLKHDTKDGHHHHHAHHNHRHDEKSKTNPSIIRIIEGRLCHTPDDIDREVRLAIVRTLTKLEKDQNVAAQALLGALEDRNPLVQKEAFASLRSMQTKALPGLLRYISKEKAVHRPKAAQLLGHIGAPALSPLKALLFVRKGSSWVYAARALQQMGVIAAPLQKDLCKLWPQQPSKQRKVLAQLFASIGLSSAACIQQRLQHPNPSIRAIAAYSAGLLAKATHSKLPTKLSKLLEVQLNDKSLKAQNEALWALGQWGKRSRSVLTKLYALEKKCKKRDESLPIIVPSSMPSSRPVKPTSNYQPTSTSCVDLLPRVWIQIAPQHPATKKHLEQWLSEKKPTFVRGASLALLHTKKLAGSLPCVLTQQLQHAHPQARKAVVEALAQHSSALSSCLPKLMQALQSKTLAIRLDALHLLTRVGRKSDLSAAIWKQLSQRVHKVKLPEQLATMKVFVMLYAKDHKGSLALGEVFLKHANPKIRIAALKLLARTPKPKPIWVRYVAYQLQDIRWKVRRAAVQTLGAWGTHAKAATESVRARIKDPSFAVSMDAQDALLKIQGK